MPEPPVIFRTARVVEVTVAGLAVAGHGAAVALAAANSHPAGVGWPARLLPVIAAAVLAWRAGTAPGVLLLGLTAGAVPYWLVLGPTRLCWLLAATLAGLSLLRGHDGPRLRPRLADPPSWSRMAGGWILVALAVYLSPPAAVPLLLAAAVSGGSELRRAIAWAPPAVIAAGAGLALAADPTRSLSPVAPVDVSRGLYGALDLVLGDRDGLLVWLPLLLVGLGLAALRREAPSPAVRAALAGSLAVAFLAPAALRAYDATGISVPGGVLAAVLVPVLVLHGPLLGRSSRVVGWCVAAFLAVATVRSLANHDVPTLPWLPAASAVPATSTEPEATWGGDRWRVLAGSNALAEPWGLRLHGPGDADLLLATPGFEHDPLVLVASRLPALTVDIEDWAEDRRLELPGGPRGTIQLLRLPTSPGWRFHAPGDGTDDRVWAWRRLRLAVAELADPRAEVIFRPLGPGTVREAFAPRTLALELPSRAVAGTADFIQVSVRNDGTCWWVPDAQPAVLLSSSFVPDPIGVRSAVHGPRARLPAPVPPGGTLQMALRIRWPDTPGRVWLTVDLALQDVAWFEELIGSPLAAGEVELAPRRSRADSPAELAAPHPSPDPTP